jgi:hypothetical protein
MVVLFLWKGPQCYVPPPLSPTKTYTTYAGRIFSAWQHKQEEVEEEEEQSGHFRDAVNPLSVELSTNPFQAGAVP